MKIDKNSQSFPDVKGNKNVQFQLHHQNNH